MLGRPAVGEGDLAAGEHFASPPSLTQAPGPGQGGWPGVPHYATHPAAYYPPTGAAFAPPMAPFSPTPAGGQGWSGYSGPITSAPPAAAALPPPASSPPALRPAIKHEAAPPAPGKEPFLGQPQHIYLTGPGYNAVPAGEVRVPPCGCGSKHGAGYRPGPYATWDCPFRYMARYGSCPGFLPSGLKDPAQWSGDHLTTPAKLQQQPAELVLGLESLVLVGQAVAPGERDEHGGDRLLEARGHAGSSAPSYIERLSLASTSSRSRVA